MKKQDRIALRTPEHAAQVSRASQKKLADSLSQTMEGLVSFSDLKTLGKTQIDGSNISTGTISADRITAGVLRSKDERSIVLDLDRGRADITGSINISGWGEQGDLIGSLRPGVLQIALTRHPDPDAEVDVRQQVLLTENSLVFSDLVKGKDLTLKLENGKGRLSGLAAPVEDTDAVNLSYLRDYVWVKIDQLRNELGLPVG